MGQFDTSYIIFINVKIFKTIFFSEKKFVMENEKSDGICEITSFVKKFVKMFVKMESL
jgi:hypothetical protein